MRGELYEYFGEMLSQADIAKKDQHFQIGIKKQEI